MTKQMLNGIRVSSKEELEKRLYKYFDEVNEVPFHTTNHTRLMILIWKRKTLNQIIYDVVNRKTAKPTDRDKRTPKPRTRKKRER